MKYLILTDGMYPSTLGGMQKHTYYLVTELLKRGHEVILVLPFKNGVDFTSGFETYGKRIEFVAIRRPVYRFPLHYLLEEYLYSRSVWKYADTLSGQAFGGILCKGFTSLVRSSKSKLSFKILVQLHGLEMFQPAFNLKQSIDNFFLRPIAARCLHNSDGILTYGGVIAALHRRIAGDRKPLFVTHGGVPKEMVLSQPRPTPKKLNFIFIGRNERRKGIPELLKATQNLWDKGATFDLHWIGELPPNVIPNCASFHYHGTINTAEKYFAILDKCEVLILSSISEGFPTVIIEAMARGLAIAATDVGAIGMAVDENTGWLIPGSRQLEKSIQTIIDTSSDEIDRRRKGAIAKIRSEFLWSSICADFEKYCALLRP
jgi:glycosyltransferase involved in cell wall biosynthesis